MSTSMAPRSSKSVGEVDGSASDVTNAVDRVKLRSMPVEFRVLGPLEIRRDGAPVSLRASKQRTFLGVLLVNHGRVVSIDRLVDDVWPEAAAAGARHALETQASRLRSLLGEDAPLVARTPGYVLEIDAQLLDSVRFEQLLDEARDALGGSANGGLTALYSLANSGSVEAGEHRDRVLALADR